VLGDIPDQPQMSAFSFPGDTGSSPMSSPQPSQPSQPSQPRLPQPPPNPRLPRAKPLPPTPGGRAASTPGRGESNGNGAGVMSDGDEDIAAEWRQVYEEFVLTKQQCGENTDGFTYEKFEQTLRKNQESLVKRHGAARVKFSVYVKDGKAALKASPLKE
jgi:hypothetical protein